MENQIKVKPDNTNIIEGTNKIKDLLKTAFEYCEEMLSVSELINNNDVEELKKASLKFASLINDLKRDLDNNRLRPCPFCHHSASIYLCDGGDYGKDSYEISCDYCTCSLSFSEDTTKEEAIKEWNTRQGA